LQAFATLQKVAEANTKSAMPFFHAQTRLPHGENLTDAQLLEVADRQEKRLGFTGQPRIASVHILPNGDRHLHVGWFRIDRETMQAIDPGLFKNHLKFLCRTLEKEYCLQEVSNFRKPEDRARAASRKEQEEARRLGTDDRAVRNAILNCLEAADGGKAFRAALDERGLMLANGDKRDCFVVVDQAGGHHALNKKLTGHTLAETRDRFADLDRTQLPSVEQAQEIQRTRAAERDRAARIDHAAQAAMQAAHADARGKYDSLRETGHKVSRDQFPGRYDDLRAAEPPPEIVREFDSSANRTAEPAAPIYDRDQDNAAWEAKLAEAAINAEAQKVRQQPGDDAGRETRGGGPEPSHSPESAASIDAGSIPEAEAVIASAPGTHTAERATGRIFGGLGALAETILGGLANFLFGGEPKLTPMQMHDRARAESNEETLHARAYTAAEQEKEAATDARIFELVRQQQQDKHREDMGLSDAPAAQRKARDDYDGGYERER
jgi:hypothetical protein